MWYNDSYPPVSFVQDGRKKGIVNDLMHSVCALTGDTFSFVQAPFQRAMLMFENGDIDIEPSVSPEWRRGGGRSVYTIPYRRTEDVMLFADERTFIDVRCPLDLKGKRIGVVRGYSYPEYDELFAAGILDRDDSRTESKLLERLLLRRVDVVFVHKPFVQYEMTRHAEYSDFRIGAVLFETDIAMRFNADKRHALSRFNRALKQLKDSGQLEAIFDKYR